MIPKNWQTFRTRSCDQTKRTRRDRFTLKPSHYGLPEHARRERPENPSTGYVWRFDVQRSKNAGIVALVDQGMSQKPADRRWIGAPGRHRWRLEGLPIGQAKLIFIKLRPSEERPAREHTVAVEVY